MWHIQQGARPSARTSYVSAVVLFAEQKRVATGILWLLFPPSLFSECVSSFCPLSPSSAILLSPLASHPPFLCHHIPSASSPELGLNTGEIRGGQRQRETLVLGDSAALWGCLDFPISDEIPRIPNIRSNLSSNLISRSLILWMRKLNHREDPPWPCHVVGQAWARVQVSWIPIQKKRRPTPCSHLSQELLPSQSTSLTFLLTCGNIKLYQDFNCNGFSSVYDKTLCPGTSVEIIFINNTYCLPLEGLLFSKQCLMDFFSFLSFKVLHLQYQNKFLTFEPK